MPKNFAFIDGANLYDSITKDLGWKLDNYRFRKYLIDKDNISKAYYFLGYRPEYENLYYYLKKDGYKLVFTPTIIKSNGEIKGNVDAKLIFAVLTQFNEYDNCNYKSFITGNQSFAHSYHLSSMYDKNW